MAIQCRDCMRRIEMIEDLEHERDALITQINQMKKQAVALRDEPKGWLHAEDRERVDSIIRGYVTGGTHVGR